MADTVVTPVGRVTFETVWEPRLNKNARPGSKPKYKIELSFPPGTDLGPMGALVEKVMGERWPAGKPKKFQNPFLKPESINNCELPDGWFVVRFSSTSKPNVVDQNVQPILETGDFYSGCWARVSCHAFAFPTDPKDTSMDPGVSFGLGNVQKMRDDEPLFGQRRNKPEDDFGAPVAAAAKTGSASSLFE